MAEITVASVTFLSVTNEMRGRDIIPACIREIPQIYGNPIVTPQYFKQDSLVAVLEYSNFQYVATPINIATLHLLRNKVKLRTIKEAITNHLNKDIIYHNNIDIVENMFTVEVYYGETDSAYNELVRNFDTNKELLLELLNSLEMYEECARVVNLNIDNVIYL